MKVVVVMLLADLNIFSTDFIYHQPMLNLHIQLTCRVFSGL